jgi:mRNA interferase MazF
VRSPRGDSRLAQTFVIVSRPGFLNVRYSTVMAAPAYSRAEGLSTEVSVGPAEGLKHPSMIRCDEISSLARTVLTDYVGALSPAKIRELNRALTIALDIDPTDIEDP